VCYVINNSKLSKADKSNSFITKFKLVYFYKIRWKDNIKMDLQEVEGVVGTGWSGLRIGTGGGHL
jgi:hypothetical protein